MRAESVGTDNIAVDSFFPALLDFSRKIKIIAIFCSGKTRSGFLNLQAALCGFFMIVSKQHSPCCQNIQRRVTDEP
jgi:hypothetical protein